MRRRDLLKGAAGVAAVNIIGRTEAQAQSWPERPVKMIVSFPAGGATDLVARPWAEALSKAFNQQFIVENRGGASGMIGNEAVFRSAPDGYTFLFTGNTGTVGVPLLYKMNFDSRKFEIAARVGDSVTGFTIHPGVGPKTLAEMLDYARKNPGKLNFGSSGPGTQPHLRHEMLRYKTGVDIAHIPYRGGSESLQDLLAGNIQLMNEASTMPHVRAGRLILLCVNRPERYHLYPDVPTLSEAGVKDADMTSWFGIYGPPGTPKEIIAKFNAKVNELSATPELKAKLELASAVPSPQGLDDLKKFWDEDWRLTEQVIKEAKIKLE